MTSPERATPLIPVLDRRRGREDGAEALQRHAGDAPADYLAGALENGHLGPETLRRLLRNRSATAELVARVGRNREWMRSQEVRIAFVANPLAPRVLARQVLPHLFWSDLADVTVNLRLSPALRRDAEKLLRTRLPELSSGERTALARRPSRGVVEMLRSDVEPAVLRALAGNPGATESDIARIVARRDVPREFLGWLSAHSAWAQRRDVLLALIRNPGTPSAAALHLVRCLAPGDRDAIRRDDAVSRLVRVAAERMEIDRPGDSATGRTRIG